MTHSMLACIHLLLACIQLADRRICASGGCHESVCNLHGLCLLTVLDTWRGELRPVSRLSETATDAVPDPVKTDASQLMHAPHCDSQRAGKLQTGPCSSACMLDSATPPVPALTWCIHGRAFDFLGRAMLTVTAVRGCGKANRLKSD